MKDCCVESFALDGIEQGFKLAKHGDRHTCHTCGSRFEMREHWTPLPADAPLTDAEVDAFLATMEVESRVNPENFRRIAHITELCLKSEMKPDLCRYCGELVGIGHPALHLGVCDDQACRDKAAKEARPH